MNVYAHTAGLLFALGIYFRKANPVAASLCLLYGLAHLVLVFRE